MTNNINQLEYWFGLGACVLSVAYAIGQILKPPYTEVKVQSLIDGAIEPITMFTFRYDRGNL